MMRPHHRHVHRVLAATVAAAALLVTACGSDGANRSASDTGATSSTASPSSSSGTSAADLGPTLVRAVTEERHAEATYRNVLSALGGIAPFSNIAASESTHVAALLDVARAHDVDVSGATAAGEPSPATKAAACQLGVDAEKADVALYDELLPQVAAHPDVVQVFMQLRAASQDNHLPAFQRCA